MSSIDLHCAHAFQLLDKNFISSIFDKHGHLDHFRLTSEGTSEVGSCHRHISVYCVCKRQCKYIYTHIYIHIYMNTLCEYIYIYINIVPIYFQIYIYIYTRHRDLEISIYIYKVYIYMFVWDIYVQTVFFQNTVPEVRLP